MYRLISSNFLKLMPLAKHGNCEAQFKMGQMYELGDVIMQDYNKAFEWYEKAAEQKNAEAQFNLGNMYWIGLGVEVDNFKAKEWYLKSAKQGLVDAQYSLGAWYINYRNSILSKKNEDMRIKRESWISACKWYGKAADQGHEIAQFCMGSILEDERDQKDAAIEWYHKSAMQGYVPAQLNLGKMCAQGICMESAYMWVSLAALKGDVSAQLYKNELEKIISPEIKRKAEARVNTKRYRLNSEPDII